jgi:site-specific DNA recombinase
MSTKTTAIYVRISQARKGVSHGVDNQEAACREYAKKQGWKVGPVLVDNDKSAYSGKKRPDYDRLLDLMRGGAIERVVAWHSDRLHRNLKELETYVDASKAHGIETHFVQAGRFDLVSASGRMNARMVGVVAQAESEHKAERMRLAQRGLTDAGKWIGGTRPFGWQIKKGGHPVIDESEAEMIRNATKRVLAGMSLGSIIREWNEAGVTTSTGKSWSYATLRQVLTRSRNAGRVSYTEADVSGPALEGSWPAIIDGAAWRAVCALLADPARRRSTSNRARWLLAGIARCECGARVRSAAVGKREGATVPIYRCRETGVGHVGRRAHEADKVVEGVLLGFLEEPENLQVLRAGHEQAGSSAKLVAEAQVLRERLEETASMFGTGEITAAQLLTITAEVRPKLEALEARTNVSSSTGALAAFLDGREGVRDVWARTGIEDRRVVLNALFDVTFLRTDRKSGRVFDPETIRITRKATP